MANKKQIKPNKPTQNKPVITKQNLISRKTYLLGFIVSAIGFLLYINTIKHGFVLDDGALITDNAIVKKGFAGIGEIFTSTYHQGINIQNDNYYRPLSLIIYAIEWQFWQENPLPFHITNLIFYAILGFVIFITLSKVFKDYNPIIPFVASLIFIAHPIHTEVVANIKSLDEILSLLFLLLTVLYFKHSLEKSSKSVFYMVLALVFYFLAFLVKESAVTFLVIFPLLVVMFEKEQIMGKLKKAALFILPFALFMILRFVILKKAGAAAGSTISIMDNLIAGSQSIAEQWATAFVFLGKYARALFFPHPLVCNMNFNQIPITNFANVWAVIPFLFYIGIAIASILTFRKHKLLSFGILFFLITISLYSNLVLLIGTNYGERLLFAPSLGFSVVIAYCISLIFKKIDIKIDSNKSIKYFFTSNVKILAIVFLIIGLYSFKTIDRNKDWASNYTLFREDIKNSQQSASLRLGYARAIRQVKVLNETIQAEKMRNLVLSIQQADTAVQIYPKYFDGYEVLGFNYYLKQDYANAVKYFETALQYGVNGGQLGLVYFDLGLANYKGKSYENATKYFEKALTYKPKGKNIYNYLGNIYFEQGIYNKALDYYNKAIELEPNNGTAWRNLGCTYGSLQQYPNALNCFNNSLKYEPESKETYNFMSIVYQNMGDKVNAEKFKRN